MMDLYRRSLSDDDDEEEPYLYSSGSEVDEILIEDPDNILGAHDAMDDPDDEPDIVILPESSPNDADQEQKSAHVAAAAEKTTHSLRGPITENCWTRLARFMARNPWYHLNIAFVISCVFAVVGMVVGNFQVTVDNGGWTSRGTLIAKRQSQAYLVLNNLNALGGGKTECWDELRDNVQAGWQIEDPTKNDHRICPPDRNRALNELASTSPGGAFQMQGPPTTMMTPSNIRYLPFTESDSFLRRLQFNVAGCDLSFYSSDNGFALTKLWPVWKTENDVSALDPQVIRDICMAEQNTLAILQNNALCSTCSSGSCLPPISLVLFARIEVGDTDLALSCDDLADAWSGSRVATTEKLQACIGKVKTSYVDELTVQQQCLPGFSTMMLDEAFGPNNNLIRYTSSIFATYGGDESFQELNTHYNEFDRADASSVVQGAYDTANEDLLQIKVDQSVGSDMILAMGSAGITLVAIFVHTRSPWITIVGVIQIILSFPLAYFVYTFIGGLVFFPFLNFIGVFVIFAVGADDIFVAIDKWKNARLENRKGSVEDIAAAALPDAAGAMFLTSITTAVAFFSTAICPVAPLQCFAIFCGLLISFDYILCVVLVFPALCIYDKWLNMGNNCFCSLHVCKKRDDAEENIFGEDERRPSLIHSIIGGFYEIVHKIRWLLLLGVIGATATSVIFASRLRPPATSDVRLLSEKKELEKSFLWRQELLYNTLSKAGGDPGVVMWGVTPADTGNYQDPTTWTQLVLDESFDPSTIDSQTYLLNFCTDFFEQPFASRLEDGSCAIAALHYWLGFQGLLGDKASSEYRLNCAGATGLPVDPAVFHPCVSAYSKANGVNAILAENGIVKIIYVLFQQRIRFDSSFSDTDKEWYILEDYFKAQRAVAPAGVNKMYHSSGDFWWYDTNKNMLATAYEAAGVTLAFSGLVVVFSSRSIILTIYSMLTIGFILTATTATLVASGWTLGFLESVCFAILIGVSCDFVIHFGHAYAILPGVVSRHVRTKYALIHMGPSILAGAFTTVAAAIIMFFTVISFFQQFAQILFYTIVYSTAGVFVVYVTLTDCIGPTQPTYFADKISEMCCSSNVNRSIKDQTAESTTDLPPDA